MGVWDDDAVHNEVAMPTVENIEQCREWLELIVDIDSRSGFYDEEDTLRVIGEIIDGELGGPVPELLAELTARAHTAFQAHEKEESSWTGRTVNDQIDDAFEDLNGRGIVAVQNLGFTLQEGAALIDVACSQHRGPVLGSVFYHRQDLEHSMTGQGLSLAFTGYTNGAPSETIGREIVHVLEHHGVSVSWDGDVERRIVIEPFSWQRRRLTKAPKGRGPAPDLPTPPEPPPPCPHCGGKGWIRGAPNTFPEVCECKGGKRRS